MYDIIHDGNPRHDYVSISGNKERLRNGEKIITLENLFMDQYISEEIKSKSKSINQSLSKMYNELQNVEERMKKLSITKFIYSFLDDWSKAGGFSNKKNNPKNNSDQGITKFDFHDESIEKRSVLSRMIESRGILFLGGNCYYVKNNQGRANSHSDYINLQGTDYELSFFKKISDFDRLYAKKMVQTLEKKFKEEVNRKRGPLEQLADLNKTGNLSNPNRLENTTGEVGYIKDGNHYYLYINIDSFTERSEKLNKKFRFSSCKVGVKLIHKDGKLNYDDNIESGMARILEAKQISNGKESGTMASVKNKDFVHPATRRTDSNPYTYLCIRGGFNYPTPSNNKSLEECIKEVLFHIKGCLGNSLFNCDSGGPLSLYRYLDTNYDQLYKPFEVRR
jgi:hypothetical protein